MGSHGSCDQSNNCNSAKRALHVATEELINISLITEIDAVVANGPWHTFAPWHSPLFQHHSDGVPATSTAILTQVFPIVMLG